METVHSILKSPLPGRPPYTFGRSNGDLFSIIQEIESAVSAYKFEKKLIVALMGCATNGSSEAHGD